MGMKSLKGALMAGSMMLAGMTVAGGAARADGEKPQYGGALEIGTVYVTLSALSFDPLSSQGMFDAIYTGLRGAEAVDAALDGDREPLRVHSERLERVRAAYLRHRRIYYAAESRWPDRPFWRRRQNGQPEPAASRATRSSSSR